MSNVSLPYPEVTKFNYRPDIDGLRAIAALSVVLFHGFPTIITGGYVGVSIFFVISGYLISSIIFKSLPKGNFDFLNFYMRRIRRLVPALVLILITALVLGWFILLADELRQLGIYVVGGATFVDNFVAWYESGYFDNQAELRPLLHLWSLAIEEQFYLFWPLALWFAWRCRWNLLLVTLLLSGISFGLNIIGIYQDPVGTFFAPWTRFYEILFGGVLAYVHQQGKGDLRAFRGQLPELIRPLCRLLVSPPGITLNNIYSWLGFSLVLYGIFCFTKQTPFPGWFSLFPVMGALLLIAAGPKAWVNQHLLANSWMVWIGLISYPLYLWHWTLLSFSRVVNGGEPRILVRLAIILISILLSWLTYRYIETPIRFGGRQRFKSIALLILMAIIGVAGFVTFSQNGFPDRPIARLYQVINPQEFEQVRASDGSCQQLLGIASIFEEVCTTNSAQPQVLFIGDSHAMAVYSSLYGKSSQLPAILVGGHACKPFLQMSYEPMNLIDMGHNCAAIAAEEVRIAQTLPSIKTVVITTKTLIFDPQAISIFSQNGKRLTQAEAFKVGYGNLVRLLQASGKRVIFFVDTPQLSSQPRDCLARFSFLQTKTCVTAQADFLQSRKAYLEAVDQLAQDHPGLIIFDPTPIFCRAGICGAHDSANIPLYRDAHHVSPHASTQIITLLKETLGLKADGQL